MNVSRTRVLLLDCDERNLIELQGELEDCGFDTTITWDGAEALRWLRANPYDVLLMGDHPPEVTASELLREVKGSGLDIQTVVVQRGHSPFNAEYYCSLGADGVIESALPAAIAQSLQEMLVPGAAAARA